jgi:LPPG:FO 2-phospho-L-lactate transferase
MKITALAGGVGGAKLAQGLAQIMPPEDLTIIVNTGDDFEHYGLAICPDLDTVCYTLAKLANPVTGWGRENESWRVIESAAKLGGPDWFRLGDLDLGTHLERTRRLAEGQPLSKVVRDFCAAWGISATVLPMSDSPVRTMVDTNEGELPFQEYFVHRHCEPRVKGFRFDGIDSAEPAPGTREALITADLIVICPSNPWVSIDPILKIPNMKQALENKKVVAVSPIIGGAAVKGPAAKMYSELGIVPSATAVANHYTGILSGFVLDNVDKTLMDTIKVRACTMDTMMNTNEDRARVARDVLHFSGSL